VRDGKRQPWRYAKAIRVWRFFALLSLLVASLAPPVVSAQAPERYLWKAEGEKAGCQILTSVVAGKQYLASKATCAIDAPLDAIGQVLREIVKYPEWMHDCSATTMLRVIDREKDIYVFWYRQHIPLFTDRDIVLRSEVLHGREDGKDWYSIVAASTNEPIHDAGKGYVRMPAFTSEWRLKEIDASHTMVSFMIDPDLGEGLPVWLTNMTITQAPFKSIQGLIKRLK
jgi:hypothetical protein